MSSQSYTDPPPILGCGKHHSHTQTRTDRSIFGNNTYPKFEDAHFEKVGKTLCHLKNPSNHGWVTIAKKNCITNNKGGKRGVLQSAVKPPKLRARKGSARKE
jgi:hypothetical protein